MSNQSHGNNVQQQLEQAVAANCLPQDVQKRAQKLLTRLKQPVRIALMGLPGSGKSNLLNLLVGTEVLSDGLRLPTLQLTHGETPQTTCTLPDGTKQTFPHTDAHQIAQLTPVYVEMHMNLPALAKISVLEVVGPKDPVALKRASLWGAKRCDIALWCSQGFGEAEQKIWAEMPDLIKDHAFLMLTKADHLKYHGLLEPTLGAARTVAKHEFNHILPIATLDALASRRSDGTIDKEQMRSSGGSALISAVLKHVELGRQSTVDMAEVLLLQHAEILDAAKPVEQATPEAESPHVPDAAPQQEPEATVAKFETPEVAHVAKITPPEPVAAAAPDASVVTLHPTTRDAYEHVITYIVDQSRALIELVEKMGESAPAQIMAKTVEHVQWLSDYLNEHGDDADPALIRARDTAMDAADLVQLMQMEKRDSAAVEALSLMIQIKHELQADLAA